MTPYQKEIVDKRRSLRQEYGGLMSARNLAHELGLRDPRAAKRWAIDHKIRAIEIPAQGGQISVKYDSDHVAKVLLTLMFPADAFE